MSMSGIREGKNAKNEFLSIISGYKLIASEIRYMDNIGISHDIKLNPLFSKNEYDVFLDSLNNDYDDGYGGQNLFGVIFCEDGAWMQRDEYDGSEWWSIYQYPDMRKSFNESDVLKYERNKKLKLIKEISKNRTIN